MPPILQPGDCLIYTGSDLIDWAIRIKTWSRACHVELYAGEGTSLASRNGIGVNRYAYRREGLIRVLRPKPPFDFPRMQAWFETVRGQKYDWLGLLCFTLAVKQGSPDKMFCSEFLTRVYRAGGFEPFQPDADADHIAPSEFMVANPFDEIYAN